MPQRLIIIVVCLIIIIPLFYKIADKPHTLRQPIDFNHQLHVKENGMGCTDCHNQVKIHQRATIPGNENCANCHEEAMTDTMAEKKLLSYIKEKIEIPWRRIYQVPDHVFFSHRQHVAIGNISCETCHGNIQDLRTPPKYPLVAPSMENCMKCHEQKHITNDCLSCHR